AEIATLCLHDALPISVTVVDALEKEGLQLLKVEPNLTNGKTEGLTDCDEAVKQADIVVDLVAHKELFNINNTNKIVLDFRGVVRSEEDAAELQSRENV